MSGSRYGVGYLFAYEKVKHAGDSSNAISKKKKRSFTLWNNKDQRGKKESYREDIHPSL